MSGLPVEVQQNWRGQCSPKQHRTQKFMQVWSFHTATINTITKNNRNTKITKSTGNSLNKYNWGSSEVAGTMLLHPVFSSFRLQYWQQCELHNRQETLILPVRGLQFLMLRNITKPQVFCIKMPEFESWKCFSKASLLMISIWGCHGMKNNNHTANSPHWLPVSPLVPINPLD